ncbi:WD40 repeat-like protein [Dacryopinax primogenitus]|uniref:WD40 repeat-like protein n=1 Tax=Dacryopinax primogenitus (strain DJM 731) TaxID=1858805 RepID=M5G7Y4_DACPD|nr:WD40 repeat-like protein [Dacryopinax primogenitus]EJT99877.1 WD40 repeat-like protein [Dacryopinax primogenitus]
MELPDHATIANVWLDEIDVEGDEVDTRDEDMDDEEDVMEDDYDEDGDFDPDEEADLLAEEGLISESEIADIRADAETSRVLEEMATQAELTNASAESVVARSQALTAVIQRLMQARRGSIRVTNAGIPTLGVRTDGGNEEEDDDDDSAFLYSRWAPPKSAARFFQPLLQPVKAGLDLLSSGEFGSTDLSLRNLSGERASLARILRERELSNNPRTREELGRTYIPNSHGTIVGLYGANVYSGQFSADSSFFYTCSQDFMLHIYDTTAPPSGQIQRPSFPQQRYRRWGIDESEEHQTTMKTVKSMRGNPGSWTITDVDLSPDNERMIYSSITSTIYMARTRDPTDEEQIPLYFHDRIGRRLRTVGDDDGGFNIWSCRFSADGTEVVAGAGNKQDGILFVYDLNAQRRVLKITAHEDDINSCCWADTASGNVLISASDDTFVKVWDRRSLSGGKPSGVLVGHTEGITNVAPKGDGRYVISNGKDQGLRLWDLRKMRSSQEFEEMSRTHYGIPEWDYRSGVYRTPRYLAHPKDCSVMTFRGHTVLRTLIRCHFSPAATTGSSYVYSGSADGKIHIWSLDGRIVQVLDRAKALPISFDASSEAPPLTSRRSQSGVIVRDVSWHTSEPVLMSSAWAGSRMASSVARHEWKGFGRNGMTLEDVVEKEAMESTERTMPGAFTSAVRDVY